ncbi:MAG: sensor domain-containing protein [Demequinaceae bacterium]|nr:sensor domain-containing protein [Demequinaceae bacterium]
MTILKRIYGPMFETKTYKEVLFLLAGLVFGILWFTVFVTLYSVGFGTIVIWIGVGILVGTHALLRGVGAVERSQVRLLLGHRVPAPAPLAFEPARDSQYPGLVNFGRRSAALLRDGHSWRVFAWTCLRIISGPLGFSFAVVYLTVPPAVFAAPLWDIFDWGRNDGYGWTGWLWFGPAAFFIVTPALAWVIRGLGDLHRWLADGLLGPGRDEVRQIALARAARAEEQIRIDQELHDSIGHMVSMIVVQAGAGAHVFDKDPAFSRRALANIEERGRAALGELDRIIAHIRGDQPETLVPLPGVEDLPGLIDGARDAGVSVSARLQVGEIPAALGRGIYRVIQEALTNAAKHAPGGEVEVVAVSDDTLVALSVSNTLTDPIPSDTTGGNGLASIRDRVTLMGGHATVGPAPDHRFAVKAVLPIEDMLPDGPPTDCSLTAKCRCLVCQTIRRSSK